MRKLLSEVDGLLRGRPTAPDDMAAGRVAVDVRLLAGAAVLLGAAYGVFMGAYAALRGGPGSLLQIASTTAKVPLLFLLTLAVTFPSLYVFSALARSRLSAGNTLRLLLAAITINTALLASFGPITGFFALSTESYPFMVLLNVAFFAVSGLMGLAFLSRCLRAVFAPAGAEPAADDPARSVFRVWTFIYAVVGAQMGWVLRPFVGAPGVPFQLFRHRQANVFVGILDALRALFS